MHSISGNLLWAYQVALAILAAGLFYFLFWGFQRWGKGPGRLVGWSRMPEARWKCMS